MTIEKRKISLINWITNLDDEAVIGQIEVFRKASLDELPEEIVKLIQYSDSESLDDGIEHTTSKDILDRK